MALGPFSNAKWRVRRSQRALGPRPCEGSFALLPCPRVLTTATRNESLNLPVSLQDFEAEAGKAAPVDFLPVHMKQNIKKPPPPPFLIWNGPAPMWSIKRSPQRASLFTPVPHVLESLSLSLSLGPCQATGPLPPSSLPSQAVLASALLLGTTMLKRQRHTLDRGSSSGSGSILNMATFFLPACCISVAAAAGCHPSASGEVERGPLLTLGFLPARA